MRGLYITPSHIYQLYDNFNLQSPPHIYNFININAVVLAQDKKYF